MCRSSHLCEFSNVGIEVKRQIIQGTSTFRLGHKAIEQSLSLEDLLKSARAMVPTNEQIYEMEKQQLVNIHIRINVLHKGKVVISVAN